MTPSSAFVQKRKDNGLDVKKSNEDTQPTSNTCGSRNVGWEIATTWGVEGGEVVPAVKSQVTE